MKKAILALLLACLLLVPCALAEGGLKITQEAFRVIDARDSDGLCYSSVAEYYAKVTNTGNQPMSMESGTLMVMGEDQVVLYMGEAYATSPHVILPGQSAYLNAGADMIGADLVGEVSGYAFDMIDAPASDGAPILLEVMEASYVEEPAPWDEADQMVFVTVRNPMDYPVENPCCSFGLYAEDSLIFTGSAQAINVRIPAGQTLVVTAAVLNDAAADWRARGLVPEVHAIAYVE